MGERQTDPGGRSLSNPDDTTSPRRRGRANLKDLFDTLAPSATAVAKTVRNSLGDLFVRVPAGSFQMGSADFRTNEGPVHEVVLTKDLLLGVFPVSQQSYLKVMKRNPAFFTPERGGGTDCPVETVTWADAVRFCELLGAHPEEVAAGRTYRLPTEAEWEYACRAGSDATVFGEGGGTFNARYSETGGPTPNGQYPPNAFGLADTLGNVWEWCADWYGERYYAATPLRDPTGPTEGTLRVVRGGSWKSHAASCRPTYRNALAPHQKNSATGFRVVLSEGA